MNTCKGCKELMVFEYMDGSTTYNCRAMESKDIKVLIDGSKGESSYPKTPSWCPKIKKED